MAQQFADHRWHRISELASHPLYRLLKHCKECSRFFVTHCLRDDIECKHRVELAQVDAAFIYNGSDAEGQESLGVFGGFIGTKSEYRAFSIWYSFEMERVHDLQTNKLSAVVETLKLLQKHSLDDQSPGHEPTCVPNTGPKYWLITTSCLDLYDLLVNRLLEWKVHNFLVSSV
jgi:hypothetical protein